MTTIIKGKNITNFYSVKANKTTKVVNDNEPKTIYTARPELVKEAKVEWEEICNFEGNLHYNDRPGLFLVGSRYINISEDEEVRIEKDIFRADLNEKHVFTNKVINEMDDYESKLSSEMIFNNELAGFNAAMINSNDAMLTYCKLHKLFPEDTDCIELFKLVYPGETYEIVDGVMKKKDKYEFSRLLANVSALEYAGTTISDCISSACSDIHTKVTCINGDAITIKP